MISSTLGFFGNNSLSLFTKLVRFALTAGVDVPDGAMVSWIVVCWDVASLCTILCTAILSIASPCVFAKPFMCHVFMVRLFSASSVIMVEREGVCREQR